MTMAERVGKVLGAAALAVFLMLGMCGWCGLAFAQDAQGAASSSASAPAEEKEPVPVLAKEVFDRPSGKWAAETVASSGTDVPYRCTVTLGDGVGDVDGYTLFIVDELPDGMEADASSVKAALDGKDLGCKVKGTGSTMTFDLGDVKAAGAHDGSVVEVTYTARITDAGAHAGFDDGYVNRAYAVYPDGKTEKAEAKVRTFAVAVLKRDQSTKAPLAGAMFALRDADGNVLRRDGTWGAYDAGTCLFETGSDGIAVLGGLAEGSYELAEVVAPDGYAASGYLVEVELDVDLAGRGLASSVRHDMSEAVSVDAASGKVTVAVDDVEADNPSESGTPSEGFEKKGSMPQTGDHVGILFACAAMAIGASIACIVALAALRRRNDEDRFGNGGMNYA